MRRFAQVLTAAALSLATVLSAQSDSSPRSYRIGPKDVIRIRVFEEPDLNVEKKVAADGTIQLPLVGELQVEGLSENELASVLKSAL